jgi:hypothetical protein
MPRFGIQALLICFSLITIWVSTYTGYPLSNDVRRIIMLLVFLTSGLAALFCRGKHQAFAVGFFAVMLAMGFSFPKDYVPTFGSVSRLITRLDSSDAERDKFYFIRDTIKSFTVITLSVIVGSVGAYIYEQNRKSVPQDRV